MKKARKAVAARVQAMGSVAVAPPADFRLSLAERRARNMLTGSMLCSGSTLRSGSLSAARSHRARLLAFLHPDDAPPSTTRDSGRAAARETMRRLVNEWDQSEGILSLDEMMSLAALGLSDDVLPCKGRASYTGKAARNLDARREEMAWHAASLEYALVWKFCEDDPELAGNATDLAGARSRIALTIERALRLYMAMLGQNLRARGVSPDRVVLFSRTGRRPANPILPEGMSFAESEVEGWHDRSPLGRALEQGKLRVNI